MKKALGQQLIIDFYDCNVEILKSTKQIELYMVEACKLAKATIVKQTFHEFSPHGVSGVVVIAESHVAIHTWPEYNYAAVDIFTCGDTVNPLIIYNYLKQKLKSTDCSKVELNRGFKTEIKGRLAEYGLLRWS